MRQSARGTTGDGKSRLRYGLVAVEVALTLIVLAGAGVMLTSVARLLRRESRARSEERAGDGMSLPQENLYYGPPGNPRFCAALAQEVGAGSRRNRGQRDWSPAADRRSRGPRGHYRRPARSGPWHQTGATYSVACPDAMKALGIPLVDGREFTVRDALEAPPVALVNEAFAKRCGRRAGGRQAFQDRDLRQRRSMADGRRRPARISAIAASTSSRARSFYRPYQQAAWPVMSILVKTAAPPRGTGFRHQARRRRRRTLPAGVRWRGRWRRCGKFGVGAAPSRCIC